MTGHFEKGAWIEDPESPVRPEEPTTLNYCVKVHVDDSELENLKDTLGEIRLLLNPPVTFWGRLRLLLFGYLGER